jgi:ATP-dependent RNA helicase SUPV3L1/SUV3
MERQAKSFEPKGSERPGQPAPHPASKPAFRPGFKPNQPGGRPGQPGGRPGQRGDFGGRPRRDRGDQVERAEREQYYAKPHGSGSGARDKAPDPNSPFAKLAALKQALEGKES